MICIIYIMSEILSYEEIIDKINAKLALHNDKSLQQGEDTVPDVTFDEMRVFMQNWRGNSECDEYIEYCLENINKNYDDMCLYK